MSTPHVPRIVESKRYEKPIPRDLPAAPRSVRQQQAEEALTALRSKLAADERGCQAPGCDAPESVRPLKHKHDSYKGKQVEITVRGTAMSDSPSWITVSTGPDESFKHWIHPGGDVDVRIITPPWVTNVLPGQVYSTRDGDYFARLSRRDLPVRMTPADLSDEAGLKTLPVEKFAELYPDAALVYSPLHPAGKRK